MLKRRSFKAGETILREGDIGETAFIIHEGRVEITKDIGGRQVPLAEVGPGDTLGEMSMIDDMPRSATAVALDDVVCDEIHHDDFYQAIQTDPQTSLLILKSLFERLREANNAVLQHRLEGVVAAPPAAAAEPAKPPVVLIEGLTPEAEEALPSCPFHIEHFPFRIGRRSHNPLVHNDLEIEDKAPWQVSRHHLAFVLKDGRVGLIDRGSTLGSEVDGKQLGGSKGEAGPIFVEGEAQLTLGQAKSPFRFQVIVQPSD
jgi:hypothetical protein